jgi:hypothetical protein
MLGARLLSLIQSHAGPLTEDTLEDLITNDRTPSFRRLRGPELESRVALLFNNLAKWIGNPSDGAVRDEYEEMGRTRFRQGVPLSELVYAIILTKKHLRRYIREHGLVDFAGDRVAPAELLPLELHSIQELNYQVGEFFDLALFYLTRGYEAEAALHVRESSPA